jgi:hypothetical protein
LEPGSCTTSSTRTVSDWVSPVAKVELQLNLRNWLLCCLCRVHGHSRVLRVWWRPVRQKFLAPSPGRQRGKRNKKFLDYSVYSAYTVTKSIGKRRDFVNGLHHSWMHCNYVKNVVRWLKKVNLPINFPKVRNLLGVTLSHWLSCRSWKLDKYLWKNEQGGLEITWEDP